MLAWCTHCTPTRTQSHARKRRLLHIDWRCNPLNRKLVLLCAISISMHQHFITIDELWKQQNIPFSAVEFQMQLIRLALASKSAERKEDLCLSTRDIFSRRWGEEATHKRWTKRNRDAFRKRKSVLMHKFTSSAEHNLWFAVPSQIQTSAHASCVMHTINCQSHTGTERISSLYRTTFTFHYFSLYAALIYHSL